MKSFLKKINNNKLLFIVSIITLFILFDFLTNGMGVWTGLVGKFVNLFEHIYNYTYYGNLFITELCWLILLILFLWLFKYKGIFSKKKVNLFNSLLIAWPIVIYSIIAFIRSILQINISKIDIYEVIGLLLFTLTIGVVEELLCRGWLQNQFIKKFGNDRKGVIFSIIISGSVFGLMHITNLFYGQDLFTTISQILYAIFMGVSFGAIYYKTKNIWSVIILHALWDFSVLFADINIASTCVEITSQINNITSILGLFALFSSLFTSFPQIAIILMLFGKNDINSGIDEKFRVELSHEEITQSQKNKNIISIVILIFLLIYGILVISTGTMKTDSCPTYLKKNSQNYEETLYNYSDYNLSIFKEIKYNECDFVDGICKEMTQNKTYKYNFNIDDKFRLILTNLTNNEKYVFEYKNVFSFAIFENNDNYNITVLSASENGDVITYYSNFITKDNINDSETFVNDFMKSFKQIMLPSIIDSVGFYQENNSDKKPLFISKTNDGYILYPDGTIYKYKRVIN